MGKKKKGSLSPLGEGSIGKGRKGGAEIEILRGKKRSSV